MDKELAFRPRDEGFQIVLEVKFKVQYCEASKLNPLQTIIWLIPWLQIVIADWSKLYMYLMRKVKVKSLIHA